MDIYQYIDNYGVYTFQEKEFNELDAALFSYLSYANLEKVLIMKEGNLIDLINGWDFLI